MLATVMGSGVPAWSSSGWISDRVSGINTLSGVLVAGGDRWWPAASSNSSLAISDPLLFMLCFAGLGAGNGALFRLVPLRWPRPPQWPVR